MFEREPNEPHFIKGARNVAWDPGRFIERRADDAIMGRTSNDPDETMRRTVVPAGKRSGEVRKSLRSFLGYKAVP
jgi:hypothetical protein